ncbi:MAG: hypothetical protein GY714_10770 [Desulfobacterales bacterium]|nr:hypothetical protein [Desulfobacterales bacterium]MCP4161598.1 hypothetical protein [Deltaproteobacteria bacterium]
MRKPFAILAIATMFLSGCGMITKGALHSARGNLEDRDYNDTLYNLTEANFSGIKAEQKPEVAFLRANALYGLDRVDEAEAILNFINTKYPESKYAPHARSLIKKWSKSNKGEY